MSPAHELDVHPCRSLYPLHNQRHREDERSEVGGGEMHPASDSRVLGWGIGRLRVAATVTVHKQKRSLGEDQKGL